MFWIIVIVIIVGYFIIKSIQESSQKNQVLIQRQIENNPVYQARYQQSLKHLNNMEDFILNIRESATEIDEQLAELGLTKKEISYLEMRRKEVYEEMGKHSSEWHKENKDKPYFNQLLLENTYIANWSNEQQIKMEELSERDRQARTKREQNYPGSTNGIKQNRIKEHHGTSTKNTN
jgi:uncharacterized membrane-anchored protein YhcB (DUF1043 family)